MSALTDYERDVFAGTGDACWCSGEGRSACFEPDKNHTLSVGTIELVRDRCRGRMSFARTRMQRMCEAGLSCRGLIARVAVVLFLSLSAVSVIADPHADVAVVTDFDDALDLAVFLAPGPVSGSLATRASVDRVPDLRFDDLRAERLESSHDWRVAFAVQARGPPI